jgi:hypothetical protein
VNSNEPFDDVSAILLLLSDQAPATFRIGLTPSVRPPVKPSPRLAEGFLFPVFL